MTAVAEIVGGDSNGDLVPDLTMTPGFNYTSQGAEDQWFNLNSDGFNLKANWANQDADGSEQTFALLTPVLSGGSAIGSQFRYTDGSGVHVLTYNGTAVEIPDGLPEHRRVQGGSRMLPGRLRSVSRPGRSIPTPIPGPASARYPAAPP